MTSSVQPKFPSAAPSTKPLFSHNTRAIVWGMQTRAVQVNNRYIFLIRYFSSVIKISLTLLEHGKLIYFVFVIYFSEYA